MKFNKATAHFSPSGHIHLTKNGAGMPLSLVLAELEGSNAVEEFVILDVAQMASRANRHHVSPGGQPAAAQSAVIVGSCQGPDPKALYLMIVYWVENSTRAVPAVAKVHKLVFLGGNVVEFEP